MRLIISIKVSNNKKRILIMKNQLSYGNNYKPILIILGIRALIFIMIDI